MRTIPAIKILSSFGIKGYTKIKPFLSNDILKKIKTLVDEEKNEYVIEDIILNGKIPKIKFLNINTPEDVSILTNRELNVDEAQLPKLEDDEIYLFELIDKDVLYKGKKIATVFSVQNFGAGDILEIEFLPEEKRETIFIPFTKDCVIVYDNYCVKITDFCYENYF